LPEVKCPYAFPAKRVQERSPLEEEQIDVDPVWENLRLKSRQMEKKSRLRFWFGWFWKRKQKKSASEEKSPSKKSEKEADVSGDKSQPPELPEPDADDSDDLLIEDDSEILSKPELKKLSDYLPSRLLCCSWCRCH